MLPCHKFCPDTHTSPKQLSISTVCCTGTLFFFFFYKLHLADHSSTPARRRHFVHNILSNSSLFKSQQAFEMSSRMSTASTLIGPPIKTNTNTVKPDASTPEIEPEYKDKDLETALRTALRTNVKLFTCRTSSGKKIDTSYLTIAKLAAEELGIEAELFYGKTWWKKVMETINDEITLLSAAFPTLSPLEATIADCLRSTIPAFVCLGTPDGNGGTKTVTDYAGIYRAVEKELGLAEKALSHNGKYKVLRREVVKEEVKKLEEEAAMAAKGKGKGKK